MGTPHMNHIQEILKKAQEGDSEAFSLIYKEYYGPIYRFIYIRTRNRELTEDLSQDVFLKIYKSIGSLNIQEKSPSAYFHMVARNTVIDYWRKKKIVTTSDDVITESLPDTAPTPIEQAKSTEQIQVIQECLKKLTPDQRDVVTLRFINDLSTKEIAQILGKNETAVRQLQVRALGRLRKLYTQQYE